jgi:hypothetical protein
MKRIGEKKDEDRIKIKGKSRFSPPPSLAYRLARGNNKEGNKCRKEKKVRKRVRPDFSPCTAAAASFVRRYLPMEWELGN